MSTYLYAANTAVIAEAIDEERAHPPVLSFVEAAVDVADGYHRAIVALNAYSCLMGDIVEAFPEVRRVIQDFALRTAACEAGIPPDEFRRAD